MRLNLKHTVLLAAFLGVPLESAARAIPTQELSGTTLHARIEIPGIPIPKPIVPKPVPKVPGTGPGRTPEIPPVKPKPDPIPPANPKPNPKNPPCKRGDEACGDADYTFSNTDYPAKGKKLIDDLKANNANPKTDDHDFAKVEGKYTVKDTKKTAPQLDKNISGWMKKKMGIDMGNVLERDSSWTRYEVYGTTKPEEVENQAAAEVFVSVKHKAILANRLFRTGDKLYSKGFTLNERLPMSEWIFQLWKKGVANGKADYNVDIKESDLKYIIGTDVDNADAKAIVAKAQQEVGGNQGQFTVKESDGAAFDALAASSSGKSKYYMLGDHNSPSELNKLKPEQVEISTEDTGKMPAIAWVLGRE